MLITEVEIRNKAGLTPLDVAKKEGRTACSITFEITQIMNSNAKVEDVIAVVDKYLP